MNRDECHGTVALTFDEEMALVERLLAEGDRGHALHHCVSALALDPAALTWRDPFREILRDGRLAKRLDESDYFGTVAARAFHRREQGALAEAIGLLTQVQQTAPHAGFHAWLVDWLHEARAKSVTIDPLSILGVLMVGMSIGIGRIRMLPGERLAAQELVPLARLVTEMIPHDGRVALVASSILRRAELYDEALAVLDRAGPLLPVEQLAVLRALALRAAGRFDEALGAFEDAYAKTNDPTLVREQVRVLADAGRWHEALAALERFTQCVDGALPGDLESALEDMFVRTAEITNPPPPREPPLDVLRRRGLGHGTLAPMTDATADILRQLGSDEGLRRQGPLAAGEAIRSGTVRVAVDGPEAPSNRLCLAMMLTGVADPRRAPYTAPPGAIRVPSSSSPYDLWRIDGDVVVQALPAPPAALLDWVERLALRERDGSVADAQFETTADFLDMWAMAEAEPPPRADAREWLAATVHPRMPVIRVATGPAWLQRWHVAALLGLAFSEVGWKGEKREALFSLLRPPMDWPAAAAIRVAVEIALRDPAATREIRQVLIDSNDVLTKDTDHGVVHALADGLAMLPCVSKPFVDRVRARLNPSVDDVSTATSPGRDAPTRSRPWWKFWGN